MDDKKIDEAAYSLATLPVTGGASPAGFTQVKGWNEAIDIAIQHIEAQHVVWDNTPIPAHALLDLIAKNLAAFKIDTDSTTMEKA